MTFALKKYKRPYIVLKGNKKERLQTAVTAIDKLLKDKNDLDRFSDSLTNSKK